MDFTQIIIVGLIGLLAGVLSGLLGLGGAIVIIPALVMLLGYSQQTAQGTTLVMMVLPVGALAAWQYYQQGFVEVKTALILAGMFFIGGYFGAKLAVHIPQEMMKKGFAVVLVLIAVKIWFDSK
ncbi:MAG: sulfite exporter TauE/SafE family protein [Chitinophagales bacterium]